MPRSRDERRLALLVGLAGWVMLLALPAAVMPRRWMADAHEWLGLGAFPETPIAEYLARSTSAMCALVGAVLVVAARHVRRYAPVIRVISVGILIAAAGGALMFLGDPAIGIHVLVDSLGACCVFAAILLFQARARRR